MDDAALQAARLLLDSLEQPGLSWAAAVVEPRAAPGRIDLLWR